MRTTHKLLLCQSESWLSLLFTQTLARLAGHENFVGVKECMGPERIKELSDMVHTHALLSHGMRVHETPSASSK